MRIAAAGGMYGNKKAHLVLHNEKLICFVTVNSERKFVITKEMEL